MRAELSLDKDVENFNLNDPEFSQFWRKGGKKTGKSIGEVETKHIPENYEDFKKVVEYLANYSRSENNQKVQDKIKGLKFFPTKKHLVRLSKGNDIPDSFETTDFTPFTKEKNKFSSSTRNNPTGEFNYETYLPIIDNDCA